MTIYGWDASNYDWGRGSMDVRAAVVDGIAFMTHKAGEGGNYTDAYFARWYQRARGVVPLCGAYYVLHPGHAEAQADRFLSLLDAQAPGWRDGPFILQADCERFKYMDRAPNKTEIKAFCDRLVERADGRYRPIVYAPKWVYADGLRGLGYPLWASAYGNNPTSHYRQAYPGDRSSRWAAYSGQTPAILQYGSCLRIGSQSTCDANAYRGSLDQLIALTGDDMALSDDDLDKVRSQVALGLYDALHVAATKQDYRDLTYDGQGSIGAAIGANLRILAVEPTVAGVLAGLGSRPAGEVAQALVAAGQDPAALAAALSALAQG